VVVNNPAPTVGPSVAAAFTVDNPKPTVANATSGGVPHVAGGTGFTLTVNGTLFVSTSAINFNGKAEPTTFVSATQLTAAIPAGDVSAAGNANVSVTNPAPAGGTSANAAFTIDGFTVAGPGTAVTVKAGQPASIPIKVTPTANGFNSTTPISFAVSGLPAHTTATFNPATTNPGTTVTTVTLMITTKARGAAPPTSPLDRPGTPLLRILPLLWLATLLAALLALLALRRTPQLRRYAAIVPLALLLVTGAVVAGCATAGGTPAGTSQLTVTATSGTLSQTTPANSVTLTVQ
jgi:hypothetical protein